MDAKKQVEMVLAEPISRLSGASLHSCYVKTLLSVLEDTFESIGGLIEKLPPGRIELGWIKAKSDIGLNVVYMAQDQLGQVKQGVDEGETLLYTINHAIRGAA